MHNQTVNGVHSSHLHFISDEVKKFHEEQINSLKSEIAYLKSVLDKVLTK